MAGFIKKIINDFITGYKAAKLWGSASVVAEPTTALLAGGLAVSALGAGAGILGEKEAAKEGERARELGNAQSELENRRRRIATIREGRIKRAQVISAGANQGAGESTGVLGGAGSVTSQTASALGNFTAQQGASKGAAQAGNRAAQATQRAGTAQAIGGVGGDIFTSQGGYKTLFQNLGV